MSEVSIRISEQTDRIAGLDFSRLDAGSGVQTFRNGMACLGSAVNVITTQFQDRPVGFTATAVSSVCDTPPILLVCLNRSSSVFTAFEEADSLCVNTLAADQERLSCLFAGKLTQQERFASVEWSSHLTGSPVLASCATAFDCSIAYRVTMWSHEVIFCEVLAVGHHPTPSNLVYFNRQYHSI